MTWLIGIITCVVDADTFDIAVERSGGSYASGIRPNETVRMVNREVNALRPEFGYNPYQQDGLVGKKIYCEIHSRQPNLQLMVTARPA
jgi:hypothetical protein